MKKNNNEAQIISPDQEKQLRAIRQFARLLDSSIRIPGTQISIGLDGLIGLVPGVGDAAGMLLSVALMYWAAKLGAPLHLVIRMFANVLVEAFVGSFPIVGDIFDFAWKANEKNVRLLESSALAGKLDQRTDREIRTLLASIIIGGLILVLLCLAVSFGILLKIFA